MEDITESKALDLAISLLFRPTVRKAVTWSGLSPEVKSRAKSLGHEKGLLFCDCLTDLGKKAAEQQLPLDQVGTFNVLDHTRP